MASAARLGSASAKLAYLPEHYVQMDETLKISGFRSPLISTSEIVGFLFEMFRNQAPKTIGRGRSATIAGSRSPICCGQWSGRALLMSIIVAAAVGGCASHGHRSEERAQRYPGNYKAELLQFLHSYTIHTFFRAGEARPLAADQPAFTAP